MKYRPRGGRARPAFKRAPSGSAAVIVGRFRYSLTRWWKGKGGKIVWVMLNPSTADAVEDDPTIRRVHGFSKAWGFSSFEVVNLFARRTKDPSHLFSLKSDIVGPQNRDYLRAAISNADQVMVAWGAAKDPRVEERVEAIKVIVRSSPIQSRPRCLGLNKDGSPKHPLYMRTDTQVGMWPDTRLNSQLYYYPRNWITSGVGGRSME